MRVFKQISLKEAIYTAVFKELILFCHRSWFFHMLYYFNSVCKKEAKKDRILNAILYLGFFCVYRLFPSISCIFSCFASLVIILKFPLFGENGKLWIKFNDGTVNQCVIAFGYFNISNFIAEIASKLKVLMMSAKSGKICRP